jgi:hypothetical protein
MRVYWLLFCLIGLSLSTWSQKVDTTTTDSLKLAKRAERRQSTQRFGLGFGTSYGWLDVDSKPYFTGDSLAQGKASSVSAVGLNIGLFWHEPFAMRWSMRFGVEANLLYTALEYPTEKPKPSVSNIYPITIDIPLQLIMGMHHRDDVEQAKGKWKTGVVAGLRPVVPLSVFHNSQPVVKNFNLNIDLGLSHPIVLKKTMMRSELFVSYALFNVIGSDQNDYRTASINRLARHFVGLRFFFN